MDFHYTHYVLPEASVPKHGCKSVMSPNFLNRLIGNAVCYCPPKNNRVHMYNLWKLKKVKAFTAYTGNILAAF